MHHTHETRATRPRRTPLAGPVLTLLVGLSALALPGCVEDTAGAARTDSARDTGAALDGSGAGSDATTDSSPETDAQVEPDAAPVDAGDLCADACARLAQCAVSVCTDFGAADATDLAARCPADCANNAAFGTVINGAGSCDTVVDFVRDRDPLFDAACTTGADPQACVDDGGCAQLGFGAICDEGVCRGPQFAACRDAGGCLPGHECRRYDPDPLADGLCVIPCQNDAACPLNESCQADLGGICYYEICGTADAAPLYGACTIGDDTGGLCYPLAASSAAAGTPGLCINGGTVPLGGACDALAQERSAEDAALRCENGICFGDPDGATRGPARGECAALCDPRDPACPEGTGCMDFSTPDDPATPMVNEYTAVGICYRSDCDARDPEVCGEGGGCRVITLTSPLGRCGNAGEGAPNSPCTVNEDCAGNALCTGEMQQCLLVCDPAVEGACGEDLGCYTEAGWVLGLCFPMSPPPPTP